jgi:hypothetical protein
MKRMSSSKKPRCDRALHADQGAGRRGRIVALYRHSSSSYPIRFANILGASFSEATMRPNPTQGDGVANNDWAFLPFARWAVRLATTAQPFSCPRVFFLSCSPYNTDMGARGGGGENDPTAQGQGRCASPPATAARSWRGR